MNIYGKKQYDKLVLILGMMALVSMLFSVCLACVETHHDCQGEDCPICACIHQCRESLRDLSAGLIPAFSVFFIVTAVYGINEFFLPFGKNDTPVSLKVRMND